MTTPPRPSTEAELHALYRDAGQAEPPPRIDRLIIDAARAELCATEVRRRAWWTGWLAPVAVAAVAVVGLSLTLRLVDDEERRLLEERHAPASQPATSPRREAAPASPPLERAAEPTPHRPAPAPLAKPAPATTTGGALPAAPPGPHPSVPSAAAAPHSPAAEVPAAASADTVAPRRAAPALTPPEGLRQRQGAEMRDASEAAAAVDPRRETPAPAGKRDAAVGKLEAVPAPLARPPSIGDPSTPEAWLDAVRELRAAGRRDEAAASLVRFRARYPDYPLPADLQ